MQNIALADFSGGLVLNADQTRIPENASPAMNNLIVDRGTLRTRYGQSRVCPLTLSNPARALFEFIDPALSNAVQWVVASANQLFSFVPAAGGTPTMTQLGTDAINGTNKIRAVQFRTIGDNRLYLCDGVNPVQYWEPSNAPAALISLTDQVAPTITPFVGAAEAYGALTYEAPYNVFPGKEVYSFAYTYTYNVEGVTVESDLSPVGQTTLYGYLDPIDYFSFACSLYETPLGLLVPSDGVHTPTIPAGVTGYNLYALGPNLGTGSQYVQLQVASTPISGGGPGTNAGYYLSIPSTPVIFEPYVNTPPVGCTLLMEWRNRMIYAKGNIAYFSDVADPTRTPLQALADMSTTYGFYLEIGSAGDIVGMFTQGEVPFFLKTRGLLYVLGYDANTIQEPVKGNMSVGCVSHETIVEVPGGHIWLDNNNLWFLPAGSNQPVRKFDHYTFDQFTLDQKQRAFAVYDDDQDIYALTFPAPANAAAGTLYLYANDARVNGTGQASGVNPPSNGSGVNMNNGNTPFLVETLGQVPAFCDIQTVALYVAVQSEPFAFDFVIGGVHYPQIASGEGYVTSAPLTTNPHTGLPWTQNDLNELQISATANFVFWGDIVQMALLVTYSPPDCGGTALYYHVSTGDITPHANLPGGCGLYSAYVDNPGSYVLDSAIASGATYAMFRLHVGVTLDTGLALAQPIPFSWQSKAFLSGNDLVSVELVNAIAALDGEGVSLNLSLLGFNGSLALATLGSSKTALPGGMTPDSLGQCKWRPNSPALAVYAILLSGESSTGAEIVAVLLQTSGQGGR